MFKAPSSIRELPRWRSLQAHSLYQQLTIIAQPQRRKNHISLMKTTQKHDSRAVSVERDKYIYLVLGYLKDSNAAAHSVDSDKFYVVINLSAISKSCIITFTS